MSVSALRVGTAGDQDVEQFTLRSDAGVEVDVLSFGVSVRDWRVPVDSGMRSVILGLKNVQDYPEHSPHFGAIAGRVANRIRNASFDLDGAQYPLATPASGLHLHGGPEGLGLQVWKGEPDSANTAVRFTHFSPDGAMGYPGNVEFTATYSLSGHTLRLELAANPDRRTPISLVQHIYFNLGSGSTVNDHTFRSTASAYTELDDSLIATGAILPVDGTKYDFRQPRRLDDAAGNTDYDINLVLPTSRKFEEPVFTVVGPDKALTLDLWTDRPAVQLYNGVTTDVRVPGHADKTYGKYSGFCLEDQAFPDAVHNPHFPDIIYGPDRPYRHWCEIRIA